MMKSLGPRPYHYRLPFFAKVVDGQTVRIDGYTPEILDHEIEFARSGGIDYWAFLLYEEENSMSDGLRLYLASRKKRDMKFCAIATPATFGSAKQFAQRMQRVIKLMGEPSYQVVLGNRPLVYLFDVQDKWLKAWGGEQNARRLLDEFRNAVKAAGRNDPYIVVMDFHPAHGKKVLETIGANAISSYAVSGGVNQPTPFVELARCAEAFWKRCHEARVEVVPLAMAGWDRRPRIEHPVPWEKYQQPGKGMERHYLMPTPKELADHVGSAMHWAVDNRDACPARAVIVYAWNEHDEGGYLCPTLNEDGTANTSRLDAIAAMKKAFHVPEGCTCRRVER